MKSLYSSVSYFSRAKFSATPAIVETNWSIVSSTGSQVIILKHLDAFMKFLEFRQSHPDKNYSYKATVVLPLALV
jgi:hypothetical protein